MFMISLTNTCTKPWTMMIKFLIHASQYLQCFALGGRHIKHVSQNFESSVLSIYSDSFGIKLFERGIKPGSINDAFNK